MTWPPTVPGLDLNSRPLSFETSALLTEQTRPDNTSPCYNISYYIYDSLCPYSIVIYSTEWTGQTRNKWVHVSFSLTRLCPKKSCPLLLLPIKVHSLCIGWSDGKYCYSPCYRILISLAGPLII